MHQQTQRSVSIEYRNNDGRTRPTNHFNSINDFVFSFQYGSPPNSAVVLILGSKDLGDKFTAIDGSDPNALKCRRVLIQYDTPLSHPFTIAAAGDLDGDHLDDFIIGVPELDNIVFFWGKGVLPEATKYFSVDQENRIFGPAGSQFGQSIAAGLDITADGIIDIAVGAPKDYSGLGAVYLFPSKKFWGNLYVPSRLVNTDATTDFYRRIMRSRSSLGCGSFVGMKDLDRDGVGDLVVACLEPTTGVNLLMIIFGSGELTLTSQVTFLEDYLDGYRGTTIQLPGPVANNPIKAFDVSCGDVDADGYPDIIVSTAVHGALILKSPGLLRAGIHSFFTLRDEASIEVFGTQFVGSLKLVANLGKGTVATKKAQYRIIDAHDAVTCPEGSFPMDEEATPLADCTFCAQGGFCPGLKHDPNPQPQYPPMWRRAPIMFALSELRPYRVASYKDTAFYIYFYDDHIYGPSLIGQVKLNDRAAQHSQLREDQDKSKEAFYILKGGMDMFRSIINLRYSFFDYGQPAGSMAKFFEVLPMDENRFVVLYLNKTDISVYAVYVDTALLDVSNPILLLPNILPKLETYDQTTFMTYGADADPKLGKIAIFFSYWEDPGPGRQTVLSTVDRGFSWTYATYTSSSPICDCRYYIFPQAPATVVIPPNDDCGHLSSAIGNKYLLTTSIVYRTSTIMRTVRFDLQTKQFAMAHDLVLNPTHGTAVYGMDLARLRGNGPTSEDFILVLNLDEYLTAFTYTVGGSGWVPKGRLRGLEKQLFSINFDIGYYEADSELGLEEQLTVAYQQVQYILAITIDESAESYFDSPARLLFAEVEPVQYRTKDEVHVWLLPSHNGIAFTAQIEDKLSGDNLIRVFLAAQVPDYAAYVMNGVPVSSRLFFFPDQGRFNQTRRYTCANDNTFTCPAGSLKEVGCTGECSLVLNSTSDFNQDSVITPSSQCAWGVFCSLGLDESLGSVRQVLESERLDIDGEYRRRVELEGIHPAKRSYSFLVHNRHSAWSIRFILDDPPEWVELRTTSMENGVLSSGAFTAASKEARPMGIRLGPRESITVTMLLDSSFFPPTTQVGETTLNLVWWIDGKREDLGAFLAPVDVSLKFVPIPLTPTVIVYAREVDTVVSKETIISEEPQPTFTLYNAIATNLITVNVRLCNASHTWLSLAAPEMRSVNNSKTLLPGVGQSLEVDFTIEPSLASPSELESGVLKSCILFLVKLDDLVNVTINRTAEVGLIIVEKCPIGTYSLTGTTRGDRDDCLPCQFGTYQDELGKSDCKRCPNNLLRTASLGSTSLDDCLPNANLYKFDNITALPCPSGANCTDATTLETLKLLPNYWRTGPKSTNILKCRRAEYCVGNQGTNNGSFTTTSPTPSPGGRRLQGSGFGDDVCRENHTGILCEECLPGYYKRRQFCEICDVDTTATDQIKAAFIMLTIILIFFAVSLAWYMSMKQKHQVKSERMKAILVAVGRLGTKLKIIIGLLQVVAATVGNFESAFPPEFQQFATAFTIFYLDVTSSLDFGCAFSFIPSSHLVTLVVSTVTPLIIAIGLWISYRLGARFIRHQFRNEPERKQELEALLRPIMFSSGLFLFFLVYPGVSNTILKTFACQHFDDGRVALVADYSISCLSPTYYGYRIYAAVMVVFYVIGVPLSFFVILYRYKKHLNPESSGLYYYDHDVTGVEKRDKDPAIKHLSFLYAPYEPFFYWFEPFDLLRKLAQTGVTVLLPTQPTQILFQFSVTLTTLMLMIELKPYIRAVDDILAVTVQFSLLMISFISFLMTVELKVQLLGIDLGALTVALFVILFIPVAIGVVQTFLDGMENDGSYDICIRHDRVITFIPKALRVGRSSARETTHGNNGGAVVATETDPERGLRTEGAVVAQVAEKESQKGT